MITYTIIYDKSLDRFNGIGVMKTKLSGKITWDGDGK